MASRGFVVIGEVDHRGKCEAAFGAEFLTRAKQHVLLQLDGFVVASDVGVGKSHFCHRNEHLGVIRAPQSAFESQCLLSHFE